MKTLAAVTALAAGIAIVGCAVHQQEAPGVSGPSQLTLVLTVTATPDSISQDGGSQSSILVTATGPSGQLVSGVGIRLDMLVNGVAQDFGTLSARNVVTNSSGAATAIYTAPPTPAGSPTPFCQANPLSTPLPGNCVSIRATPTGTTTAASDQSFTTTIRLVPPGVILPPVKTPKAAFSFLPSAPQVGQSVVFDGSASCAEADTSGACVATTTATIVSYAWNFGDGGTASGKNATHTYGSPGSFVATLTVTNSTGGAASTSQVVTVTFPSAPTADFVQSPPGNIPVTAPSCGVVFFNADNSKAAPGHNIVQYSWNFGDNFAPGTPAPGCSAPAGGNANTASGFQVSHQFTVAGSYSVVLSVLDDTGQKTTKSVTVTAVP